MKISTIILIILANSSLLFTSCKKDDLIKQELTTIVPIADTTKVVSPPKPIGYKRTIVLGTGSGNLTIDGKKFATQCHDLILIKAGSYKSIDIRNILSADGCPVTIKNEGLVELAGDFNQMTITDVNNLVISGDGKEGLKQGFVFRDNKYRAVQIYGSLNNFTFQYASFKNIGDYVISLQNEKAYTGAEDSYSRNLKFLHNTCDNTSQFLSTAGSVYNGEIKGLVKNIEVAYLDFQNSPSAGPAVYMGNAEDYDIHHNRVNNVNTAINNHNGLFSISGNGKFHDNYISNHQGNSIRAWGHTMGTNAKNIYIYNNIVVNSRKYSAFEVQAFDFAMIAGKTTFANAYVFNNTCGNLNTSNDWQGNVVDVYNLSGGKCEVFNNLAYNFQKGSVIAGQQSYLVANTHDNLYYATSKEAGLIDQNAFKISSTSPAKNKGSRTPFAISDYYGNARNGSTPSIGAVE